MPPHEKTWDKGLQTLLIFIVAFNIIPSVTDIPPWITILSVLFLIWKTLILYRGVTAPRRWLLWTTATAGCVGIFFEYGTILGAEPASALLVFLATCKLLETNRYRDAMLVIFMSYYMLMAFLLNSQSLVATVFMACDVLLITLLMFQLHKKDRRSSLRSLKPAMRMMALSVPVWAFLFFAFPRFSAGLWNLQSVNKPNSGFSDELSPGDVEKIIENEEPVFRVEFANSRAYSPSLMYWRGGVLAKSDGLKWTKNLALPPEILPKDEQQNSVADYEVWLEPGYYKWLFLLDYPTDFSADGRLTKLLPRPVPGLAYETARDVLTRLSFTAGTLKQAPAQKLTAIERQEYLQAPPEIDPQVKKLVAELEQKIKSVSSSEPRERVASRIVLDWFDDHGFRYTKSPGTLSARSGPSQLTEFLFTTRRGFCEHYAAAYAYLMRALKVPARVSVGFQGGQYNQLGQYLIVRGLDAHAWAEIWIEENKIESRGRWTRVDPTETIAPLRIQLGGDFNRVDSETLAAGLSQEEIRKKLDAGMQGLISRLALTWDVAQTKWNGFLLRYDFEFQRSLLSQLGLGESARMILLIWVGVFLAIFVGALNFVLRKRATREDPLLVSWRRFCKEIEKAGVTRGQTEGPHAFATRVATKWPTQSREIFEIALEFIELRYGESAANSELRSRTKKFRHSVRRFSIRPSSRPISS